MSPVAIALWSLALKPSDEPYCLIPQSDLRITNIALADELADESGRTSVKLTYQTPVKIDDEDDEANDEEAPEPLSTTVLGSLTPGKIEQATVDLILEEDEEYLFEVVGKNTIFLTGNYIDQISRDDAPYAEDSMSEDDYDLREVSSDVEVDLDAIELPSGGEDAHRFEEIKDTEAPKSLKRLRDSDAMETDTPSKNQQKKLNKKLKVDDGKAVATGSGDDEKKPQKEDDKKGDDGKKTKKEKKKEKQKEKKDVESKDEGKDKKDVSSATKTLEGGVKVTDVKIGTGPQAKKGNTASIRYIGKLTNGTIFDDNRSGKPFKFRLGEGSVIKGWDVGIAGMQVGGERELTIPPAMGYGNRKSGKIPSGSTLLFSCKLLGLN